MKEILTICALWGVDVLTKQWAQTRLPLYEKREIVKNHLYFKHIKNDGIAYNKCSGERKKILLLTGGILGFYALLLCRWKGRRQTMPLAFLLGGGIGNLCERLRRGAVTDFLYVPVKGKRMPVFNLADVFIALGALGMAFVSWREK